MAVEYTADQYVHDEVNLQRLVRRLEKSAATHDWDQSKVQWNWIQTQSTIQKVKYARKLLKNVETYNPDLSPAKVAALESIRGLLNKLESFAKEVEGRTAPKQKRTGSLLSELPLPPPPYFDSDEAALIQDDAMSQSAKSGAPSDIQSDMIPSSIDGDMDTPSEVSFTSLVPTLIPSTLPSSATKSTTTTAVSLTSGLSGHTQSRLPNNSAALQEELSNQLALMATQLKRNAMHFSESMAKDKAVMEMMDEKLIGNHDVMQKEHKRLSAHRSKSRGTTCMVFMIILAVLAIFMLMISIIRFT